MTPTLFVTVLILVGGADTSESFTILLGKGPSGGPIPVSFA